MHKGGLIVTKQSLPAFATFIAIRIYYASYLRTPISVSEGKYTFIFLAKNTSISMALVI